MLRFYAARACDNPVMEDHIRALIEAVGENPDREGLLRTPERAARAALPDPGLRAGSERSGQ
jgi:GTP cyclohydrolase I